MCKEMHDYKLWASSWGGHVCAGSEGQEKLSRDGGTERMFQKSEYTELYQDEQAQAVVGELSIPIVAAVCRMRNWPEIDKVGEWLSEGP